MNEQQKKQAEKVITFAKNPQLALFDELQEINDSLKILTGKEKLIVEATLKTKEVNLDETNNLIQKLLEKETEPIEITLDIE